MKQAFQFSGQAGGGIKEIYEAIEGLKQLKRQHKEQLDRDLDISHELEAIKENLEVLIAKAEETEG